MENFEKWWVKYIFRGQTGDVSEAQFVKALQQEFSTDKGKFVKNMEQCFDMLFDVIDTNKDRSISEDEFFIAFKAYGHEHVAADKNFFQAYTPVDGLVPLKDIVASWVDFVTSTDSTKPGAVKTAFEAHA